MVIDGFQFDDSGLMPKTDDAEFEWTRPDFSSAVDPIAAGVTWIGDIVTQNQIVWPAERDGKLQPPPVQHVLDRLVRSRIAGESAEVEAELVLRPDPGTVAVVHQLPRCDLCTRGGVERPARYDSTITGRSGMANMCIEHYLEHSPRRLGLAWGQYLVTRDEVPAAVLEAYDRAIGYWGFGG